MKKMMYHALAGIMALAAAANYLAPAAPMISAEAMPAAAPAVTASYLANSMGGNGYQVMTTGYHPSFFYPSGTTSPNPTIQYDSWHDICQDGHFRYASESSDFSECVVREVLDDEKTVKIPRGLFSDKFQYANYTSWTAGVEYDGTAVKAGEGVRQRELFLDDHISFLTLYDFSADENVEDNPENYYDLFTSITVLNPKCTIDIPQIDAVLKLLHENGLELTICGLEDSTAEQYAKKHGLPFVNALKTVGDFTYCIHADHASVYKWDGSDAEVTIPAEIDGLPVTEIDDYAFNYKECLKAVEMPDTITRIGIEAFASNRDLSSVRFSASLRRIDEWAFWNVCLRSADLPEGLISIGQEAFHNTSLESVVIPDSVTEIGMGVFDGCRDLTEITLSAGLKKIPARLLCSASSLKKVTIPDSVTEIGECAFEDCRALENVVFPKHLTAIGEKAFQETAISSARLPDSVTEIGERAFEICKGLTEIELPEGLKSIGDDAFSFTAIQSVTVPDSITQFGDSVFYECEQLESVNLPKNLTALPDRTFCRCIKLKAIELPETLETIGDSAFLNCSELESFEMPDTVTEIGESLLCTCFALKNVRLSKNLTEIPVGLFSGCSSLETVEIPASVTFIGTGVFSNCKALTSVTVLSKDCKFNGNPVSSNSSELWERTEPLKLIGYPDSTAQAAAKQYGLVFQTLDGSTVIEPQLTDCLEFQIREDGAWVTGMNSSMKELTIPAEYEGVPVVGIASEAFMWYAPARLILPDTITTLEENAFTGSDVQYIELSKKLKTIGKSAFYYSSLRSIVIPEGVTAIPPYAFYECPHLSEVTLPESVEYIGRGAFGECDSLSKLIIPNGDCEFVMFFDTLSLRLAIEEGEPVPTVYSTKDSAVHGYADYIGLPFCTLDGTPVTEPSATKYIPTKYEVDRNAEFPVETTAWDEDMDEWFVTSTMYGGGTTIFVTAGPENPSLGDINLNGKCEISDAILLARVIAEDTTVSVTMEGLLNADMNANDTFDQADLTLLLKRLAGL